MIFKEKDVIIAEPAFVPIKVRGFEVVSGFEVKNMPLRKTEFSAGYDIFANASVIIEPLGVAFVTTGLKAYMPSDEYLALHIRSGIATKRGLMLINSTGIVDSDYYNNEDNEGHIQFAFFNTRNYPVKIEAGERIGQGIFCKYFTADGDIPGGKRTGGFNSTGVN
jgi:dUTP pyrophosphatase